MLFHFKFGDPYSFIYIIYYVNRTKVHET